MLRCSYLLIVWTRKRQLSDRDLRALAFIGEGYEVAQYQLEAATFPDRSPTVASRFVRRMVARGVVIAERLNGIGMNRLRITPAGLNVLTDAGCAAERLFAPRRSVAPKDFLHTLRINDLRTVLLTRNHPPVELWPAWALQRSVSADVVPDILAVWHAENGSRVLLACEIDRGTESLAQIFLPKLRRLTESLRESGGRAAILVLTEGRRRIERLTAAASAFDHLIVEELPGATGPAALLRLREQLHV